MPKYFGWFHFALVHLVVFLCGFLGLILARSYSSEITCTRIGLPTYQWTWKVGGLTQLNNFSSDVQQGNVLKGGSALRQACRSNIWVDRVSSGFLHACSALEISCMNALPALTYGEIYSCADLLVSQWKVAWISVFC